MDDLYDEFGNYIGPEEDDNSSSSSGAEDEELDDELDQVKKGKENELKETSMEDEDDEEELTTNAIVLHEDKKYYPDADEVFPDAEVLVEDEDQQNIEEPILKPVKVKAFSVLSNEAPSTRYSLEYLVGMMNTPSLIRNVCVAGHLHHGKTRFCDILVEQTLEENWDVLSEVRYCDTRQDEQDRKMSIKSCPISLGLEDGRGKSFVVNVVDCPGHVNFSDEVTMAMRVSDGLVLVVDAVEGMMLSTRMAIKQACDQRLPICLVISKVDRLIHEVKLPPNDAYLKLVNIIDSVNAQVRQAKPDHRINLSPETGNVCFSSGSDGWCFSLQSFARLYLDQQGPSWKSVDPAAFSKQLWGNRFFDPSSRKFVMEQTSSKQPRSFVQFVLEPLYKLYAQLLGESPDALAHTLKKVGVVLSKKELEQDPKPLLRTALRRFFGSQGVSGFVDMVTTFVPAPGISHLSDTAWDAIKGGAQSIPMVNRLAELYPVGRDSPVLRSLVECNASAPLVVQVAKLYSTPDGKSFSAFGKVFAGTICMGQSVRILGEAFSKGDKEDMCTGTISGLSICQARHRITVDQVVAGNWVMIDGLDDLIAKSATLCTIETDVDSLIGFAPVKFDNAAVVKLAIEPLNPRELPKMFHGLRSVSKSYPLLKTKVEESGEHVIFGTGELYMDCVMRDLREMYAEIEIKVSDPLVSFCETVVDTSAFKVHADTPNKMNRLSMIASPLEDGLGEAIESGKISHELSPPQLSEFLMSDFGWDKLAARSLWGFGPDGQGPNVFINDTLPSEVDQTLLSALKPAVVQGFRWATREGPLCDEPIRNVKFRLLDASIAKDPLHRGAGFVIPTARRVTHSAFLTATPRLMEPVYYIEIQSPADLRNAIQKVLQRRRGGITDSRPVPGSPFTLFHGTIPVIDSFGFETDLRIHTQGLAFVQQIFDRWSVLRSDPLDESIVLRPLEPSRGRELAREFLIKTRRRKGLPQDLSVSKFFADDDDLMDAYRRLTMDDRDTEEH